LGDKSQINEFPLFDDIIFSDMYLLKLKAMLHTDFSSTNLAMFERPDYVHEAYISICNMTIKFMNYNFKGDPSFKEALNVYSKELYSGFRKKESKGVPKVVKEAYINFVNESGIDAGIETYYDTKKNFPDYQLFDYRAFRDVGFLFMMQKDFVNALKAYKVLLDAYPDKDDSYRRVGEAHMENGNYKEAREFLNRGLELNPSSPALKDILRRLKEREERK